MIPQRKAVFLDRDGVINRSILRDGRPYPPLTLAEVDILPGAKSAIQKLRNADFLVICVTNQPDVARGTQNRKTVEEINAFLFKAVGLDDIMACYHDDIDNCSCRKPLPGMLFKAAEKFSINLKESYMVGDRWRDINAGIAAGCRTFFIDYGYNEKQPKSANLRVKSLLEAANIILNGEKDEEN